MAANVRCHKTKLSMHTMSRVSMCTPAVIVHLYRVCCTLSPLKQHMADGFFNSAFRKPHTQVGGFPVSNMNGNGVRRTNIIG